jgi:hypothetical protein
MQPLPYRSAPAVVLLLATIVTLLLGCGGPGDHTPRLPTADPASANVVLWVSNQSFIDQSVHITVKIDGRAIIDQEFDVEGQHNWIKFPLAVDPGPHALAISSDTGARLIDQLVVPETGLRYASDPGLGEVSRADELADCGGHDWNAWPGDDQLIDGPEVAPICDPGYGPRWPGLSFAAPMSVAHNSQREGDPALSCPRSNLPHSQKAPYNR